MNLMPDGLCCQGMAINMVSQVGVSVLPPPPLYPASHSALFSELAQYHTFCGGQRELLPGLEEL